MKSATGSLSSLQLLLCVSLPLAFVWSLPFGHGISVEAFPLLLGLLVAGLAGTVKLGRVPRGALAWVALVVAVLMFRGSGVPLYDLMLLPVGVAVWAGFALGDAVRDDMRVARAVGLGLGIGLAVNFVSAVLQFAHLDMHFHPWITPGGWSVGSDRVYGNLRQANHLGMFFALSLAPLWWMAARRVLSPGGAAIGVAAASLVIALSGSRIALVSVFAVALAALGWRRSLPGRALAAFLAAPLLVLLFAQGAGEYAAWAGRGTAGVLSRDTETVSLRMLHWRAALELIEAQPWWGVGWREFRHARFLLHPEHAAIEIAEHAHNLFLHLGAEIGLPLMLLILAPVLAFVVRGRPWRARDPAVQAGWLVLLLIFLYSQVEFPLWVMDFQFLAAMAAGMVLGRAGDGPAEGEGRWGFPRIAGWGLTALALAALVDYDRIAAPTHQGSVLDWGATPQERLDAASRTFLFRAHVDMMLLPAVVVTEENHREVLQRTGDLMHFGPEPQVLALRLVAHCVAGERDEARATERLYRLGFPGHHAEFRRDLMRDFAARCGLDPVEVGPGDPGAQALPRVSAGGRTAAGS